MKRGNGVKGVRPAHFLDASTTYDVGPNISLTVKSETQLCELNTEPVFILGI